MQAGTPDVLSTTGSREASRRALACAGLALQPGGPSGVAATLPSMNSLRRAAHAWLMLALAAGCFTESDPGDAPDCATGLDPNPCGEDEFLYGCACDLDTDGFFCNQGNAIEFDSCREENECFQDTDQVDWCTGVCGAYDDDDRFVPMPAMIPCVDYEPMGSCGAWSPASHIGLSGGVRYVDEAWLAGVVANPAPLWTCDDAYLAGVTNHSTGFIVTNASSGELLYELGLRDGDRTLDVNGYDLDTWRDGLVAAAALYFSGATTYTLHVERCPTICVSVTLNYVLQ